MNIKLILISILSLTACSTATPVVTPKNDQSLPPLIVGGDKDEHGCKASAGYTWSKVLNQCIRIWETANNLKNFGDNSPSKYYYVANKDGVFEFFGLNESSLIFTYRDKILVSSDNNFCFTPKIPDSAEQKPMMLLSTRHPEMGCEHEGLAYYEIAAK